MRGCLFCLNTLANASVTMNADGRLQSFLSLIPFSTFLVESTEAPQPIARRAPKSSNPRGITTERRMFMRSRAGIVRYFLLLVQETGNRRYSCPCTPAAPGRLRPAGQMSSGVGKTGRSDRLSSPPPPLRLATPTLPQVCGSVSSACESKLERFVSDRARRGWQSFQQFTQCHMSP